MVTLFNAVVASPLPTVLPSPQVVQHYFTTTIPVQTPPVVLQLADLAAMFAVAFVISIAHSVVERLSAGKAGWDQTTNQIVATMYSLLVGVVGTAQAHLLTDSLGKVVALVVGTCVALAGTFWTYEMRKLLARVTGFSKAAPADAPVLPTVPNP